MALVNFAKYCGYEYASSDAEDVITVVNHQKKYYHQNQDILEEDLKKSKELKFKLYHTLEFTSDRKRMSIILKDL